MRSVLLSALLVAGAMCGTRLLAQDQTTGQCATANAPWTLRFWLLRFGDCASGQCASGQCASGQRASGFECASGHCASGGCASGCCDCQCASGCCDDGAARSARRQQLRHLRLPSGAVQPLRLRRSVPRRLPALQARHLLDLPPSTAPRQQVLRCIAPANPLGTATTTTRSGCAGVPGHSAERRNAHRL